jgi:hypothetical protein
VQQALARVRGQSVATECWRGVGELQPCSFYARVFVARLEIRPQRTHPAFGRRILEGTASFGSRVRFSSSDSLHATRSSVLTWMMLIPAAIALRKFSSSIPDPPCSVRKMPASSHVGLARLKGLVKTLAKGIAVNRGPSLRAFASLPCSVSGRSVRPMCWPGDRPGRLAVTSQVQWRNPAHIFTLPAYISKA